MGQVCPKHEEFYEGKCRWCEDGSATAGAIFLPAMTPEEFKATYQQVPIIATQRCFCCGAPAVFITTMSPNIEITLCAAHARPLGASRRLP